MDEELKLDDTESAFVSANELDTESVMSFHTAVSDSETDDRKSLDMSVNLFTFQRWLRYIQKLDSIPCKLSFRHPKIIHACQRYLKFLPNPAHL
jgi:hypothetical protein